MGSIPLKDVGRRKDFIFTLEKQRVNNKTVQSQRISIWHQRRELCVQNGYMANQVPSKAWSMTNRSASPIKYWRATVVEPVGATPDWPIVTIVEPLSNWEGLRWTTGRPDRG